MSYFQKKPLIHDPQDNKVNGFKQSSLETMHLSNIKEAADFAPMKTSSSFGTIPGRPYFTERSDSCWGMI